jgi:hypothetical protein
MSSSNVVYFSFVIACNIEPAMLIGRVGIKWTMTSSSRLILKALQCFDAMTLLVFYYLFNESQADTILEEFQNILTNTQLLYIDDMDISMEATMGALPSIEFHKLMPKVPGQDTLSFKHISHKAQFARWAWHLEVEYSKVPMIKELVEKAKELGCIEVFWATVNQHTNYQCSMTIELLKGIIDVDYATSYCSPEEGVHGEVTL